MKHLIVSVTAALLLLVPHVSPAQTSPGSASSGQATGKVKSKRAPIRAEALACRDRLRELADLSDHMDAITPEKLMATQKEINDCVYAESAGLSKADIVAAYKLRDDNGKEVLRRIREAVEQNASEKNTLHEAARKLAQGLVDEDKAYRDLIERYNTLVDSYNSLLAEHRQTLLSDLRFLNLMQQQVQQSSYDCEVRALRSMLNSAPQRSAPAVREPPAQIHCTTQTMPPPIPGLSSWSYTDCH